MTAVAGDGRSVADGGPADGWATPAEPTPPAAAAAPPSTDSGNPATPPLATVEAGDNDGDSTAPPPAPAAPALPGDPGADLLPQDYPPPALNTRYPAGTRQPLSPVRADLARGNEMDQFVFLADETFANEKKMSADETLTANERLSETSQNLSLAITLSLAVAKTVGMLNCSLNSLHSTNERF